MLNYLPVLYWLKEPLATSHTLWIKEHLSNCSCPRNACVTWTDTDTQIIKTKKNVQLYLFKLKFQTADGNRNKWKKWSNYVKLLSVSQWKIHQCDFKIPEQNVRPVLTGPVKSTAHHFPSSETCSTECGVGGGVPGQTQTTGRDIQSCNRQKNDTWILSPGVPFNYTLFRHRDCVLKGHSLSSRDTHRNIYRWSTGRPGIYVTQSRGRERYWKTGLATCQDTVEATCA